MYTLLSEDELYHHGVLGMKWGVRRYQNKDGSLTSTGKRRQKKNLKSKINDARTKRLQKSINAIDKDIASFKSLNKDGVYDKNGKMLIGPKQIRDSIAGLEKVKANQEAKLKKINNGKAIVEKVVASKPKQEKSKFETATDKAFKSNPNLTYNKIYKEMKVNMDSEDPDIYRQAEEKWLKKHGYM